MATMRDEYELKGGKRNPYARRLGKAGRDAVVAQFGEAEGFVKLDADVAEAFPSSRDVNDALRLVLRLRDVGANARGPRKAESRSKRPRPRAGTR